MHRYSLWKHVVFMNAMNYWIYIHIYYIVIILYTANKPFWRPVYKCRMQLCDLCWHVTSVVNRATSFFLTHSLVLNAYSPAMLVPDIVHHR